MRAITSRKSSIFRKKFSVCSLIKFYFSVNLHFNFLVSFLSSEIENKNLRMIEIEKTFMKFQNSILSKLSLFDRTHDEFSKILAFTKIEKERLLVGFFDFCYHLVTAGLFLCRFCYQQNNLKSTILKRNYLILVQM